MRSRSLAAQHDAAVARRLELLTTELAAVRERGPGSDTLVRPAASGGPHRDNEVRLVPDHMTGVPVDVEQVGPAPTTARMPGRHASRRAPMSWALGLADAVRGRVALGPGQLAVVAVLAAVGLALTCWWLVRSAGHEVVAPTVVT